MATGVCKVVSWDITFLRTSISDLFFYLYMIMDRDSGRPLAYIDELRDVKYSWNHGNVFEESVCQKPIQISVVHWSRSQES